jgi:hypothetical protein
MRVMALQTRLTEAGAARRDRGGPVHGRPGLPLLRPQAKGAV